MILRVLIVDDELMARKRLRRFIQSSEGLAICGECSHGREAIETIRNVDPDLVLLDVQMPEVDGFQVIETIGTHRMPAVIFVTAYEQHSLRAFEAQAIDYLLKPVSQARFAQAVERARRYLAGRDGPPPQRQLAGLKRPVRIAVKSNGRTLFVRAEDIDWVEAMGDYVKLHIGKESHLLRTRMNDLEKKLEPIRFRRIHRSTIVNLDRVKEIRALFQGNSVVVLSTGQQFNASAASTKNLQDALEAFV